MMINTKEPSLPYEDVDDDAAYQKMKHDSRLLHGKRALITDKLPDLAYSYDQYNGTTTMMEASAIESENFV